MSKYQVRIRQKNPDGSVGKIVGRLGKYARKKDAVTDAQHLADKRVFNPDTQITVEQIAQGSPRSRGGALRKSQEIARKYNPSTGWTGKGPIWKHSSGAYYGRWPAGGWWGLTASGAGRRFNNKPDAQAWAKGMPTDSSGSRVEIPSAWIAPPKKTRRKRRNPARRHPTFKFTGPVADNDRFTGPVADNDRVIRRVRNPSTWKFMGHEVVGKSGDWTVLPYGKRFKTKDAAKKWIRRHVRSA